MAPSGPVFDLKALEADLVAKGVPALENLGKLAVDTVLPWLEKSFQDAVAVNPLWALATPVISAVQTELDKLLTPKA